MSCSGPTLTTKFIHADKQGQSTNHNASDLVTAAAGDRQIQLEAIGVISSLSTGPCTQTSQGKMFNTFSITPKLRQYPTSLADRTAVRLVKIMEKDPQGEVSFNASYLKLLPMRLAESPALRNCVAFFCYTWTHFEVDDSMQQNPAFIESYGKALRSLMKAVRHPETQYSAETCAAVTLMARCNLLFDSERLAIHADGLAKMMRTKGPPKKGDELHKQLVICNKDIVATNWAAHGGEEFSWFDSWREPLGCDVPPGEVSLSQSDTQHRILLLQYLLAQWPTMITCMSKVRNPNTTDHEAKRLAHWGYELATNFVRQSDSIYPLVVEEYQSGTLMRSALGNDYPSLAQVDTLPSNYVDLLRLLAGYMSVRILYSRMAFELSCTLGNPNCAMYDKYHGTCRQAWGLLPHIATVGPLTILSSIFPVFLCFEIIEEQVNKDYLIDTLKKTNVRRVLPVGRKETERWLLNTCRLLTGRRLIKEDMCNKSRQSSDLGMDIYTQYTTGNTFFRVY